MHAWLFVNEVFELKHAIVRRQYKPIHRIFGAESLRTFVQAFYLPQKFLYATIIAYVVVL